MQCTNQSQQVDMRTEHWHKAMALWRQWTFCTPAVPPAPVHRWPAANLADGCRPRDQDSESLSFHMITHSAGRPATMSSRGSNDAVHDAIDDEIGIRLPGNVADRWIYY